MKKVCGKNAKRKAVVSAVLSALFLLGGGNALAISISEPSIPTGITYDWGGDFETELGDAVVKDGKVTYELSGMTYESTLPTKAQNFTWAKDKSMEIYGSNIKNNYDDSSTNVYGLKVYSGYTFTNNGTITIYSGAGDIAKYAHGMCLEGTFNNASSGVLYIKNGNPNGDSYGGWGVRSTTGIFNNYGTVILDGENKKYGSEIVFQGSAKFINKSGGVLSVTNHGQLTLTSLVNEKGARIISRGGDGFDSVESIDISSVSASTKTISENYGEMELYGGSKYIATGISIYVDFANRTGGKIVSYGGTITSADGLIVGGQDKIFTNEAGAEFYAYGNKDKEVTTHLWARANGASGFHTKRASVINYGVFNFEGGKSARAFGGEVDREFINKNGGIVNAIGNGGLGLQVTMFTNEAGGVLNIVGGNSSTVYGMYASTGGVVNNGIINMNAKQSLNALILLGRSDTFKQQSSTAQLNGNLLAFIARQSDFGVSFVTNNNQLEQTQNFRGIKDLGNFLCSGISAGTINITDTDISEESQARIREAIYGTGVSKNVSITFAGTGTTEVGSKVIDLAHCQTFIKAGNEGSVLYEDTMDAVSGGLTVGNSSSAMGSLGFKLVASDAVTITDGKALTLLGDGTQLAGTAGKVTVNNGELKLGFVHDVTKDVTQGGELAAVSLADSGKLSVADVNGTYRISDRLSLADKATLTNAGKLSVASMTFVGNNATVTNTGVSVVQAVSGSGKGNTLKNAGIYSQTDLSAFGDIQNKGTLKTGTLTVGAADKLVNGGTILAEKITVDGLLQNRNGTFALGTAAVAKYLEKHLDLAQQLKDLGETLPTSVENLLAAQADAEAASLTTLELADSERPVESDDETSETVEGMDFASWFAAMQAANAPQGRLATREGRLAFAGLAAYADNQAQLERQLQSGVSGLWADVIASQSEMDGYKANRSGIAVGLQGTNDVGLTFGVAARYSDGKLKGDTLASENWTSAGGSAYAAWANDDAFVSGFFGYDNLKTKGSDKLTNDVVSVGVKSGLKFDVGPVYVMPFVGGEVVHQKVKGLDAATTYRFPMGVGMSGQYETYGAWQVHPSLEVAFVPQAGDKVIDVTDKVDSRFAGNYAVESRLGVAVEKKNLMLGINYHGSVGDAGLRSHSLQANVKYRF